MSFALVRLHPQLPAGPVRDCPGTRSVLHTIGNPVIRARWLDTARKLLSAFSAEDLDADFRRNVPRAYSIP